MTAEGTTFERIVVAFIGALPAAIAAIATLIVALRTHTSVNGRMEELLKAKLAQGRQAERDSQRGSGI